MSDTDGAEDGNRELVALDEDECRQLLGLQSLGRIGFCSSPDEPPDVVPINYLYRHGQIWFRTHDESPLARLVGQRVAMQTDHFDWVHRIGWSVLAHGVVEVDDEQRFEVDSWAPGDLEHLMRFAITRLTGRRIAWHQRSLDSWGYL